MIAAPAAVISKPSNKAGLLGEEEDDESSWHGSKAAARAVALPPAAAATAPAPAPAAAAPAQPAALGSRKPATTSGASASRSLFDSDDEGDDSLFGPKSKAKPASGAAPPPVTTSKGALAAQGMGATSAKAESMQQPLSSTAAGAGPLDALQSPHESKPTGFPPQQADQPKPAPPISTTPAADATPAASVPKRAMPLPPPVAARAKSVALPSAARPSGTSSVDAAGDAEEPAGPRMKIQFDPSKLLPGARPPPFRSQAAHADSSDTDSSSAASSPADSHSFSAAGGADLSGKAKQMREPASNVAPSATVARVEGGTAGETGAGAMLPSLTRARPRAPAHRLPPSATASGLGEVADAYVVPKGPSPPPPLSKRLDKIDSSHTREVPAPSAVAASDAPDRSPAASLSIQRSSSPRALLPPASLSGIDGPPPLEGASAAAPAPRRADNLFESDSDSDSEVPPAIASNGPSAPTKSASPPAAAASEPKRSAPVRNLFEEDDEDDDEESSLPALAKQQSAAQSGDASATTHQPQAKAQAATASRSSGAGGASGERQQLMPTRPGTASEKGVFEEDEDEDEEAEAEDVKPLALSLVSASAKPTRDPWLDDGTREDEEELVCIFPALFECVLYINFNLRMYSTCIRTSDCR